MPSITYLPDDVTQLHAHLNPLFTVETEQLAEQTKFSCRPGKFTGTTFAQTLVLGYLHKPDATLPELASYAADFGTLASTQALDQRFTPHSADFMRKIISAKLRFLQVCQEQIRPILHQMLGLPSVIWLLGGPDWQPQAKS